MSRHHWRKAWRVARLLAPEHFGDAAIQLPIFHIPMQYRLAAYCALRDRGSN